MMAKVTTRVENGEQIYIYQEDDQMKVQAALIELKDYREKYPQLSDQIVSLEKENQSLQQDQYKFKSQRNTFIFTTVVLLVVEGLRIIGGSQN